MNVFISYDHRDEKKASKLENDLISQNIGIWIDKKCIKPGNIWLKEIDEGLSQRQVEYVLGIVTENYIESTGMIEAYAKISEGLGKKDIKFIPLFFEEIKKINSVILKAIQGFKFLDYDKGLLELIKFLKSEVHEDSTELLSKIEGVSSKNPFRRIRAEYFEDDFSLLAQAFADPEKERYELVRSRTPLFIFGGRGSGKTMLLKSLTPEVLISRFQVKTFKEVKQKGIDYFGIYLRLVRGSFSLADNNTILKLGFLNLNLPIDPNYYKTLWEKINKNIFDDDPIIGSGTNAALIIFLHEINFKILKTILTKLKQLQQKKLIEIDTEAEQNITSSIIKKLSPNLTINTFSDFLGFLDIELDKIKDYLQKITMPSLGTFSPNWVITSHDFLDQICKIFLDNISDLKDTKIYLLLDEFENLYSYQQKIINEWVKTSNNLVVKSELNSKVCTPI